MIRYKELETVVDEMLKDTENEQVEKGSLEEAYNRGAKEALLNVLRVAEQLN